MSTPHDLFNPRPAYQWSLTRGGRPENAMSYWKCRKCGKEFVHRYNIEPNIYKDAAAQGFDLDHCEAEENPKKRA